MAKCVNVGNVKKLLRINFVWNFLAIMIMDENWFDNINGNSVKDRYERKWGEFKAKKFSRIRCNIIGKHEMWKSC